MKNRFIEETKERKNHDIRVKKWKERGVEMESRNEWEKWRVVAVVLTNIECEI